MHGNPGEWLVKYMAPLRGAKIVDVTFKRDEELGDFPVLIVQPTEKQLPPSYWEEMANTPPGGRGDRRGVRRASGSREAEGDRDRNQPRRRGQRPGLPVRVATAALGPQIGRPSGPRADCDPSRQ
jgi:hypothetical protein